MKDVKGFCKMFDLNMPCHSEFEYYSGQFSRLERWKDMKDLVRLYEEAEGLHGDLFSYRMAKIDEIVEFVQSTRAYQDLCDENLLPDYPTTKSFDYQEGKTYLSIDLKKANWQSVKWHDPAFVNELGDSYDEFLQKFGLPEVFRRSKHFRQYIFGGLNPKKQMKMQRVILEHVISSLEEIGLKPIMVKHDEALYDVSLEAAANICEQSGRELLIREGIVRNTPNFPPIEAGAKLFSVEKVEDYRINRYLSLSGEEIHSEPVACSGHRFFMSLRKDVFKEPYDIRDLWFRIDDRVAIWKIDGLLADLANNNRDI